MPISQADIEFHFNRFRKVRFFSQGRRYEIEEKRLPRGPRVAMATHDDAVGERFHACLLLRAEDEFTFVGSYVDDDRPKDERMSDEVAVLVPDRQSAVDLVTALRWAADELEARLNG